MRTLPAIVVSLVIAGSAPATTLAPITLDRQIEKASQIFRGRVQSVTSSEEKSGAIVTVVKVAKIASYKGSVPDVVTFRLLGGKVGDREMRVDGIPEFEVGKEYVLFLADSGRKACPIVGWTEGTLPVDAQGKVQLSETVRKGLQPANAAASAAAPALGTLGAFESALREKIATVSTP